MWTVLNLLRVDHSFPGRLKLLVPRKMRRKNNTYPSISLLIYLSLLPFTHLFLSLLFPFLSITSHWIQCFFHLSLALSFHLSLSRHTVFLSLRRAVSNNNVVINSSSLMSADSEVSDSLHGLKLKPWWWSQWGTVLFWPTESAFTGARESGEREKERERERGRKKERERERKREDGWRDRGRKEIRRDSTISRLSVSVYIHSVSLRNSLHRTSITSSQSSVYGRHLV